MDTRQSTATFPVLRPVISPDFEWDDTTCGVAEFNPEVVRPPVYRAEREGSVAAKIANRPVPSAISASCVGQWVAAFAVLAAAGLVIGDLLHRCGAERALQEAARAAALEATLPKATPHSVAATAQRRLVNYPELASSVQITLLCNGDAVGNRLALRGEDRIAVSLSVPATTLASKWARRFPRRHQVQRVTAHAEYVIPGPALGAIAGSTR